MEFGRLDDVDKVDFTLPTDHPDTAAVLGDYMPQQKERQIYIGGAKWGRKEWVNLIYPKGTKAADYLTWYGKQFNGIELNGTHYNFPSELQTAKWAASVPDGFLFCPKVTNSISHYARLKNAEEMTETFCEGVRGFGDKLGSVFLQMPDNFNPTRFDDLANYIQNWPTDIQLSVELRNANWYSDERAADEAFSLLSENGVGYVITDVAGRRDILHQRLTGPFAFVRFVGNNLHTTDFVRVEEWAHRIKEWFDQGLHTLHFYVHEHDETHTPVMCEYTIETFNKVLGTKIKKPEFYNQQGLL